MIAQQIETIETSTDETVVPTESPRLTYLHQQANLADAAAQAALQVIQQAQAALDVVATTQATRAQAVAQAEAEAQTAATRSLTEGTGEARSAERRADGTAQRLRREMARAEAAVQAIRAKLATAQAAYGPAAQAAVQAAYQYELASLTERQEARMVREREIRQELVRLAAEGRADNREAARLYRSHFGNAVSDDRARPAMQRALYLPGEGDAEQMLNQRTAVAEDFARDGLRVIYALDLRRTDVDEETARNRALYDLD